MGCLLPLRGSGHQGSVSPSLTPGTKPPVFQGSSTLLGNQGCVRLTWQFWKLCESNNLCFKNNQHQWLWQCWSY